MPFDRLSFVQRLREAGFQPRQAEVLVEALADLVYGQVATKQDLAELRADLKGHIASELNAHLRWTLGTVLTVSVAAVGALFALFKFVLLPGLH